MTPRPPEESLAGERFLRPIRPPLPLRRLRRPYAYRLRSFVRPHASGAMRMRDPLPRRRRASRSERDRRYRQRKAKCVGTALIEFDGAVVDMLVRLGWLDELGAGAEIGAAVSRMLADSAARMLK